MIDPNHVLACGEAADKHVAKLQRLFVKMALGLRAVEALMLESKGVTGLHANGDLAYWGDLRKGGKYEEWLRSFDEALECIDAAKRGGEPR